MYFNKDIIKLAKENDYFRKEIVTGKSAQVVLMSIPVNQEIGLETHNVDQILIFVQGSGEAILNGESTHVGQNSLVFVSAGTKHNFKNTGSEPLKLFTVYAPPQHPAGTEEKENTEY